MFHVSLFTLSLLLITCTHANIVHFNTSAGYLCNNLCYFNDSSIWMKGTVPVEDDQVYINVDSMDSPVYIQMTYSSISSLDLLSLSGPVSFYLVGALMGFKNCTIDDSASMIVQAGAIFSSGNTLQMGRNSSLKLTDSSIFLQDVATTFYTSVTSSVELYDSSAMFLSSPELAYFSGYLYVAAQVTFSAVLASFQDITILFDGAPQFETANFGFAKALFLGGLVATGEIICDEKANITIFGSIDIAALSISQGSELQLINATGSLSGLNGAGSPGVLDISSSNIAISALGLSSIAVSLHLRGNMTVSLENIILNTPIFFDIGYFGEPADININTDSIVQFEGTYTIPGQITVTSGRFTNSGNLTISGGIFSQGATIVNDGIIIAGDHIVLDFSEDTNTTSSLTLRFPASVTAPSIRIHNSSQLLTKGAVSIFGDVLNSGVLLINRGMETSDDQSLSIFGNYTQLDDGIFVTYLETNITSTVWVSDTAFLSGLISYTFTGEISKNAKFETLRAEKRIGDFNDSLHAYAPSGQLDVVNLKVQYDKSSVYLVLDDKSKNIFELWGLEWWIWAAILIAVVLLLIITIISMVIYVHRSKAKLKYQMIRDQDSSTSSTEYNP